MSRFLPRTALAVALAIVSLTTLPVDPAAAQEPPLDVAPPSHETQQDLIWDVATADPSVRHTGRLRPLVFDLEERDGRLYIGGKFLNVQDPTGMLYDHAYVAVFDVDTGAWIDSFVPEIDGAVYSMDFTDDGRLLVGGELTGGIAALDPITGARDATFDPGIENSWGTPAVFDVEVVGSSVYAGGRFARAQGVTLANLGRFDVTTGAIDPAWVPTTQLDLSTPRLGGQLVYGIAVDPARQRVYVVGKFGSINDDESAAYFGILDPTTGALRADVPQGLPPNTLSHRDSFSMWQHDVQFRGDRVYVGGQGHQTLILEAADLTPTHSFFTNRGVGDAAAGGDTQVIFLGENTLWAGCHCWGSVGPYPLGSYNNTNPDGTMTYDEYRAWVIDFRDVDPFGQQRVYGTYGIDLDTGRLSGQTFELSGQAGAWAIHEDGNGRLWLGGQFRPRNGRPDSGLVRFSPLGGVSPDPVANCTATTDGVQVSVEWSAAARAEDYLVHREVNGGTRYWRGRTTGTSFVDSDRTGELAYFVTARGAGVSASPVACETVADPGPDDGPTPVVSCTVDVVDAVATLSWPTAERADSYVVRRSVDGAGPYWRGRTEQSSFTDALRPGTIVYSVATKLGAEQADPVICDQG